LPVTLVLDDSQTIRPGALRVGKLETSGVYPTVQVSVILSKAGLLGFLDADKAILTWPQTALHLDNNRIGGVRAFTRILLCAPGSFPQVKSAN
jgi:hypothetical protein